MIFSFALLGLAMGMAIDIIFQALPSRYKIYPSYPPITPDVFSRHVIAYYNSGRRMNS